MSTIEIEKYVDGVCVEALNLPLAPLQFVSGLLPRQAHEQLRRRGIDIDALLDGTPVAQWLDVQEGQTAKRIRVIRRD
ncbi:class I SAM-dependent methyltransferase [Devosia aquimaris]|uniref:hypothetical protein n=1 Tax=Devosia aquimaris TaxID=2866214 RepID=UPI001CD0A097|nr:hypothetical protein [Devosia sp. CJK-A8-3]